MTPSPAAPPFDAERAIRMACQTLRIEAEALLQLQPGDPQAQQLLQRLRGGS